MRGQGSGFGRAGVGVCIPMQEHGNESKIRGLGA